VEVAHYLVFLCCITFEKSFLFLSLKLVMLQNGDENASSI
jgi:hypothetical protein